VAAIRATNRTQRLVLGFFAAVWVALVAILLTAPETYDSTLRLGPGAHLLPDLAFLVAISVLIAILVIAALNRSRWIFWPVVIAFLFGILRVPASALQLMNVLPTSGPTWYVLLQAAIGVAQFVIALAMIAGYRRAGIWGAF
jgi:hypothetical protein